MSVCVRWTESQEPLWPVFPPAFSMQGCRNIRNVEYPELEGINKITDSNSWPCIGHNPILSSGAVSQTSWSSGSFGTIPWGAWEVPSTLSLIFNLNLPWHCSSCSLGPVPVPESRDQCLPRLLLSRGRCRVLGLLCENCQSCAIFLCIVGSTSKTKNIIKRISLGLLQVFWDFFFKTLKFL